MSAADGSHLWLLDGAFAKPDGHYGLSPSFSPDGKRVVYAAFDDSAKIVVSAPNGSGRRTLISPEPRSRIFRNPTWSPDGKRIAFVAPSVHEYEDGFKKLRDLAVYTMAADGSDVRSVAPSIRAMGSAPVWSPDSRSLAFIAYEHDPDLDRRPTPQTLYTVGADGTDLTRIGWTTMLPTWSPDGSRIAFMSAEEFYDSMKIYTVAPDGSDLTMLFDTEVEDLFDVHNLLWSPDGTAILYSQSWYGYEIVSVKADGSEARRLVEFEDRPRVIRASWSPDGSRIAVHVSRTEDEGLVSPASGVMLFVMDADGLNRRILARSVPGLSEVRGEKLESAGGELWPTRFQHAAVPTSTLLPQGQTPASKLSISPGTREPSRSTSARMPTNGQLGPQPKKPCTGGSSTSCSTRNVNHFSVVGGSAGAASPGEGGVYSLEEVLEKGLFASEASPVQVAFRGTEQEGSIRCDWRGFAMTAGQREDTIRFWLAKEDDDPLPTATQVEAEFRTHINDLASRYRDYVSAVFVPLARGGLSTDLVVLTCYASYRVHEYLVGSGISNLTVAYDHLGEARSYDQYSRAHAAGEFGDPASTPLLTEAEYGEMLEQVVSRAEGELDDAIGGREGVLFLAPMGAHGAIAVEVWQVVAQWDLQTDDQGTVNAVRYGVSSGDPEQTQTLANLKSRVTTAAASDAFADDRTSNLNQYYRDIGAYGDITPDDGSTATFTPSQPPPVYAPAPTGLSATASGIHGANLTWNPVANKSGFHVQHRISGDEDWTTLADVTSGESHAASLLLCDMTHEFRVGTYGDGATYNSRVGLWTDVATLTTAACGPQAPVFVDTPYSFEVSEDAQVGEPVGSVSAIDVNADTVTYTITAGNTGNAFVIDGGGAITVAGALDHETTAGYTLTLTASDGKGGTATATVTVAVTDVAEDPPPAPSGLTVTLDDGVFTISWTAVDGADRYEVQHRTDAAGSGWTALPQAAGANVTYAPVGGPACGTEYRFRVRAYGDGENYTQMWSAQSPAATHETESCNQAPAFDRDSYNFEVAEDTEVGSPVGTVSATDGDQDDLSYEITAGNTGDVFAIDDEGGAITVAVDLDHETVASYTLTVEASDGQGGTDTATVTVTVTDVAEDPPPAPSGLAVRLADGAFTVSWTALEGAVRYEVQQRTDASGSGWTALPETTGLSATYTPGDGPTCSTEYRFRVRAYGDGETYTRMWSIESGVESVDTATCDPEFGQAVYHFYILDTTAVDGAVSTVAATDPDADDTVSYSITAGNEDGKFSISGTTGQLTVAGALDISATPYYTLTVEASDGNGGSDTATVTVALTIAECYNGTVVWRADERPRLVRDCSVLLTAKDTLRGTASLDWSPDLSIYRWQGIFGGFVGGRTSLDGTLRHVKDVIVSRLGLNGTIPTVLSGLADLRRLDLDENRLTGGIPAELGQLESLEMLHLFGNRLSGAIPAELGNLSNLRVLSIWANDLTGNIPPELGDLTKLERLLLDDNDFTGQLPSELGNITGLERLYVRDNRLSGEIPSWLASLGDLEHLYLEGNDFTGCIPDGLRDVANNDLDRIGLADCSASDAAGAPTVSGTAQVGQTLTADTTGITDADGLTNVTYGYQWVRVDGDTATDIAGATGAMYTLVDADEGKTIRVRVSFTDDRDHAEELTSAETATVGARPNSAAGGAPMIGGTAQVGQALTAVTTGITDADGLGDVTYSYQWVRVDGDTDSDIAGATGSMYTLVDADEGKTIRVRVSFTDDRDHAEELTSAATATVAARPNRAAGGVPTISGTAQVGQKMTADTTGITDADGLSDVTYSYQWVRVDGDTDTDIAGATGATYTLVDADEGKTIRVRVSFTDDRDHAEELTSAATAAVAAAPVWSVEMTVADYGGGDVGAISANLFSNETGSLHIQSLWYSGSLRRLYLSFREAVTEAEALTLQIGDLSLAFPEDSSGDAGFTFRDVDISWTAGQTVAVSIVR